MTPQLTIRKADINDRDTIYGMICRLEDAVLDRKAFDFAFDHNIRAAHITYFIAVHKGEAVGMVSCHIQPLLHHAALVSEIQEMFVEPEHRSLGVGNALMNEVVAHAKQAGAIQMEVTSRATRERAHQFYQKEGFEKSHVKLVRYFNK